MNKILSVALREFAETVKTRAFFLGVVIMPALILLVVYGAEKLGDYAQEELPPRKLAVIDEHGAIFEPLERELSAFNQQNPNQTIVPQREAQQSTEALNQRVRQGELYAYLLIPAEAVAGTAPAQLGRTDNQLSALRAIDRALDEAVSAVRFAAHDPPIDREVFKRLTQPTQLTEVNVETGQKRADDMMARLLTPFAFMFLLYFGTFGISFGLLTSVLEEKSSRIVEVLLAAISPTQLMAGKILGTVMIGFLVLAAWLGVGYVTARSYDMAHLIGAERLGYLALYFVPGFLFNAALLAGIGAACNTLKEAQSMSSPLNLINIVPMVLWFPITQSPGSLLSIVLSFIPPITPFVMILRLCADPDLPVWQVVATLLVLWAAVVGLIFAAGKVFRVGVLMYGKAPNLSELLRWVRYA